MSTFTKGPWNIHRAYPLDTEVRTTKPDGDGKTIDYWEGVIAQGEKIIAKAELQIASNGGWPHVEDVEEARANALLLTAAPRLHAAVTEAIKLLAGYDFLDEPAAEVLTMLREALAASEGRVIG